MYINIAIRIVQRVIGLRIVNVILATVRIINGLKGMFVRAIVQLATMPHQADITVNTSSQHQQEPAELAIQTADFVWATVIHATCVETTPF